MTSLPFTICIVEGCNEPRLASASGATLYPRCEKHVRAQWSATGAQRYKKPHAPRKKAADSQPRAPRVARVARVAAETLILINQANGEVLTVKVISRAARHLHDLNAHTIPILVRGGALVADIVEQEARGGS